MAFDLRHFDEDAEVNAVPDENLGNSVVAVARLGFRSAVDRIPLLMSPNSYTYTRYIESVPFNHEPL